MSSTTSLLKKHYTRILRLWPRDHLRPGVQVHDSLKRRVYERVLQPEEAAAALQPNINAESQTPSSDPSQTSRRAPQDKEARARAALIAQQLPQLDAQAELAQMNALNALLENRFARKYPVSEEMYAPGSRPSYYADLLAEQEEAPTRTWLGRKWLRLSNLVRFNP